MKSKDLAWSHYLFYGLGRRLSLLGERLGIQWLIYNPIHFWHFHGHALANAPLVIEAILNVFPSVKRVLDVGAGSGGYAAEAKRRGLHVDGCEHSAAGRRVAKKQGLDILAFDLARTPPAFTTPPYDLAYCFEVAEHLPPILGARLIEYLVQQSSIVVFSAAHPGQGGTGHVNEQPKAYWIDAFAKHGYTLDPVKSDLLVHNFRSERVPGAWFAANTMVFRSASDVSSGVCREGN